MSPTDLLRRAKHDSGRFVRELLLERSFRRLRAAGRRGGSRSVLRGLIAGWGNTVWSARTDLLAELIQARREWPGDSLECGSGLTSLVAAEVARQSGAHHVALENDAYWCERVRAQAEHFGLSAHLTVLHCPLRSFDTYDWYGVDPAVLPERIQLLICDGPPGTTRGGRYGALPRLRDRLWPGALILVDDADRPAEKAMVARWQAEFGTVALAPRGHGGACLRLRVPASGL